MLDPACNISMFSLEGSRPGGIRVPIPYILKKQKKKNGQACRINLSCNGGFFFYGRGSDFSPSCPLFSTFFATQLLDESRLIFPRRLLFLGVGCGVGIFLVWARIGWLCTLDNKSACQCVNMASTESCTPHDVREIPPTCVVNQSQLCGSRSGL